MSSKIIAGRRKENDFMRVILFSANYFKLLFDVLTGKRQTSYPLSLRWRWRHKNYTDL